MVIFPQALGLNHPYLCPCGTAWRPDRWSRPACRPIERLEYDLLFRWFVGIGVDDAAWVGPQADCQFSGGRARKRRKASSVARPLFAKRRH